MERTTIPTTIISTTRGTLEDKGDNTTGTAGAHVGGAAAGQNKTRASSDGSSIGVHVSVNSVEAMIGTYAADQEHYN